MITPIKEIKKQQAQSLKRLIEFVGGQSRLADELGISRQVVHSWCKRGRISAMMAIEVERISNGAFTKQELRPDVKKWIKE